MTELDRVRADCADWKAYSLAMGETIARLRKQARATDPFMWVVVGDGVKLTAKQAFFIGYSRADAEDWIAKMKDERPDLVFSDPVPLYTAADRPLI